MSSSHVVYYCLPQTDPEMVTALVATDNGWRCRSTRRDYQHDYVGPTTPKEVAREWMYQADRMRVELTPDREEALERLSKTIRTQGHAGFLWARATEAPYEAAERVLRHVERGW